MQPIYKHVSVLRSDRRTEFLQNFPIRGLRLDSESCGHGINSSPTINDLVQTWTRVIESGWTHILYE